MTAPMKLPPRDTGACGTERGYDRHRRRGQRPCFPCKVGRAEADKARESARLHRRDRYAAVWGGPLPVCFGRYAALDVPHDFEALHPTMGLPQCLHCLGWSDDVRHPVVGR